MVVDRNQSVGTYEYRTPVGISVAVGAVLVVGAALLAAALGSSYRYLRSIGGAEQDGPPR